MRRLFFSYQCQYVLIVLQVYLHPLHSTQLGLAIAEFHYALEVVHPEIINLLNAIIKWLIFKAPETTQNHGWQRRGGGDRGR